MKFTTNVGMLIEAGISDIAILKENVKGTFFGFVRDDILLVLGDANEDKLIKVFSARDQQTFWISLDELINDVIIGNTKILTGFMVI